VILLGNLTTREKDATIGNQTTVLCFWLGPYVANHATKQLILVSLFGAKINHGRLSK
jgi:hypothetical protein